MNAIIKRTYTVSLAIVAFLFLSPAFGLPWDNAPKNEISWSDNLRQAQELSRQTGKPVLLHFFSDTCPPCKMMEKSTFPNPAITEAVQSSFIPVKLNVKHYPREAQMFNVQGVPTDIVLTPDGQQVHFAVGGQDANRYSQFLATAQIAVKQYMGRLVSNDQVGTATISGNNANQNPPSFPPSVNEPGQNNDSLPPMPDFPAPSNPGAFQAAGPVKIEAGGACPINETPSFDYASIPEEEKAMIEFEGYCPVELEQHSLWIRGDYNNRLVYEDRLYFFAGKAQMEEFNQHPEKYAPMYQGIDVVVLKERKEIVHGIRNYGAWAIARGKVKRVFLFSSEENLKKFERNPQFYLTPEKK